MVVPLVAQAEFRDPAAAPAVRHYLQHSATPIEAAAVAALLQACKVGSVRPASAAPALQRSRAGQSLASAAGDAADAPTATTGVGAPLQPRPSSASAAKSQRQTQASAAASTAQADLMPAALPAPAAVCFQAPDWVTTNDQFYGFRELHPEIYSAAAEATKARPAPNLTFRSAYSDSLKAGAGNVWKQYLCTTNELVNRRVHKPDGATQAQKGSSFCAWMRKQRLYYGELMTEAAAARLDAALEAATSEERLRLLAAARLLYSIVQPERCWAVRALESLPFIAATYMHVPSFTSPHGSPIARMWKACSAVSRTSAPCCALSNLHLCEH